MRTSTLAALLVFCACAAEAVEYIPVYNATLLGGQYFFAGTRANLSGNASFLAAPIFKTSERWSLVPIYAGAFQGTKGVGDNVGAGTLFQQSMDHRISFMGIRSAKGSSWKLKPALSYKRQFLKETRDESWGHGLFDYEKVAVGVEAENVYRDPFSVRLGLDLYRIRFPNYQSLESQVGTDPQGNPLGRELASKNVLDSYNYQASVNATRPFPYDEPVVVLQGGYSFLFQDFADQRIVDARGQFMNAGRRDYLQSLSGSATYPKTVRWGQRTYRMNLGFGLTLGYNRSNQNTFDASRAQFIPDSYSYFTFGLGPNVNWNWGDPRRPTSVSASFRFQRTQYEGRLAQTSEGPYTSRHQYQDRYLATVSYAYPIAPGFSLKAQTNLLWTASNMRYEKTYQYTYRTANYLMGFTYEY